MSIANEKISSLLSLVKGMHAICFKGIFRSLLMIKIENNMFYGVTVGASSAGYTYFHIKQEVLFIIMLYDVLQFISFITNNYLDQRRVFLDGFLTKNYQAHACLSNFFLYFKNNIFMWHSLKFGEDGRGRRQIIDLIIHNLLAISALPPGPLKSKSWYNYRFCFFYRKYVWL